MLAWQAHARPGPTIGRGLPSLGLNGPIGREDRGAAGTDAEETSGIVLQWRTELRDGIDMHRLRAPIRQRCLQILQWHLVSLAWAAQHGLLLLHGPTAWPASPSDEASTPPSLLPTAPSPARLHMVGSTF